jgi:hypothetical protein
MYPRRPRAFEGHLSEDHGLTNAVSEDHVLKRRGFTRSGGHGYFGNHVRPAITI